MEKLNSESSPLKPLGSIVTLMHMGHLPPVVEQKSGNQPVIKLADISQLRTPFIHKCKTFLDQNNITNKYKAKSGDIVIIYKSGSQHMVGKAFLYLGEEECIIGRNMYLIKHSQNPKYLIHILNSAFVQKQIQIATGKGHMHGLLRRIRGEDLANLLIPVPDLETQEQIANRLNDLFLAKHELIISLEEMVDVRRRQYEQYKERLLIGGIDRWGVRSLGEIAIEIFIGSEIKKDQLGTGEYPAIKCGDVNSGLPLYFTECISFVNPDLISRKRYFEHGDILIGKIGNKHTSGTAVAYLGNEKCLLGDAVYVLKHLQNPKYLALMLSTKYVRNQIMTFYKPGTVFNFFLSEIKRLHIPLPPLEDQERIVLQLDKHRTELMELEKISEGLKEAREKQYRCISDRILGFNL